MSAQYILIDVASTSAWFTHATASGATWSSYASLAHQTLYLWRLRRTKGTRCHSTGGAVCELIGGKAPCHHATQERTGGARHGLSSGQPSSRGGQGWREWSAPSCSCLHRGSLASRSRTGRAGRVAQVANTGAGNASAFLRCVVAGGLLGPGAKRKMDKKGVGSSLEPASMAAPRECFPN